MAARDDEVDAGGRGGGLDGGGWSAVDDWGWWMWWE